MISTNNSTACFTSNTCEWETPQDLFDKLNDTFHFDLDVCATPENAKCERYFTKEDDGLKQEWSGRCWMNPPYGKEIADWMRKAYESINLGGVELVCCLVPARTDTKWFHDYAMQGEIHFIRGRLKFGNSQNSAPFPSMIVLFRKKVEL